MVYLHNMVAPHTSHITHHTLFLRKRQWKTSVRRQFERTSVRPLRENERTERRTEEGEVDEGGGGESESTGII